MEPKNLVDRKVFLKVGTTGRGTYYILNPALKTQKGQIIPEIFTIKSSDLVLKVSENVRLVKQIFGV